MLLDPIKFQQGLIYALWIITEFYANAVDMILLLQVIS